MSLLRVAGLSLMLGLLWKAAPQSASLPTYWRYAHPRAKFLVGIDMKGAASSPLGIKLKDQFASMGKLKTNATESEMEMFNSVDRVFISSPGNPAQFTSKSQPQMVAVIQGNFDLAKVRKLVSAKGTRKAYRGVEMWTDNSAGSKGMAALVSPQLILFGDQASLQAAIDHHASADAAKAYDPIFLRAMELAPLYDIWLVGDAPPHTVSGGSSPQMAAFEKVKSFEMGLSLKTGVGLQLNLNANTEEEAKTLAQGLAGLMAFAAASQSSDPTIGDMMKRVRFGNAGAQAQIAASWSVAEVDSGMQALAAQFMGGAKDAFSAVQARPAVRGGTGWNVNVNPATAGAANPNAQPPEPVAPPQPTGPLKVKILNSEDGDKEVVISQH